jgi:hypothetical protein
MCPTKISQRRYKMDNLLETFEKLGFPSQGSVTEKIDKLVRAEERKKLIEMLKGVQGKENFPVTLYRHIKQVGYTQPALLRFSLPKWRAYDEVFWLALCGYLILALHSVTDIDYDRQRAVIKINYIARNDPKTPEEITEIISGITCLINGEELPTDFTLYRALSERQGSLGDMSKRQAAFIAALIKFTSII